jgi:hypothetical protein
MEHSKQENTVHSAKTRTRTTTATRTKSRVGTGTARARTAKNNLEDIYVVALIENKVKEVGLAAYNLRSFDIELRQYADTNCFASTMTVLTILRFVPTALLRLYHERLAHFGAHFGD